MKYIAGLFDAEGYIRLTPKGGVDTCIGMTSYDCIKFYADKFGLTIKTSKKSNRKTMYTVRTSKHFKTKEVLMALLPYLNEKYFQAKCVLMYLNGKNLAVCHTLYTKNRYHNYIINKPSIPYLAGLIDGDGWASFLGKKGEQIHLTMGLKQCFKAMPVFLQKTYGGYIGHYPGKYIGCRPLAEWVISKESSLKLIDALEPFCIRNKLKFNLLQEYHKKDSELRELRTKELDSIYLRYKELQNKGIFGGF